MQSWLVQNGRIDDTIQNTQLIHNQTLEKSIMATVSENAELRVNGQLYELPIHAGTEGNRAIDISRLRSETGHIALDEGYANTDSATSEITYIVVATI